MSKWVLEHEVISMNPDLVLVTACSLDIRLNAVDDFSIEGAVKSIVWSCRSLKSYEREAH